MLSVVVYGRNDSHGYNLHKRVAVSLNALAEVMDDVDDEILFVDYNSADQLPTLPEALADTLTAKARRHLRVLRVRPAQHRRFLAATHLPVVEPVARNVALRRANPANPWMLLANTDMILVPPPGDSLTAIVGGLDPGLYHLPRFDLPESVWEGFDRRDPAGFIDTVRAWAPRLRLDETVLGLEATVYDNPGDFQLFPRAALAAIDGLDEAMVNGWVVDSNVALRLSMVLGPSGSLAGRLAGYHCSHVRQSGVFHDHTHVENDFQRFYANVTRPDLPHQAGLWGLPDCEIEDIRLGRAERGPPVWAAALPPETGQAVVSSYRPESFDQPGYAVDHVLPFLADLVAHTARATRFGWCGARPAMQAAFAEFCRLDGRPTPLTVDDPGWAAAEVFIFEFGAASDDDHGSAMAWRHGDLMALAPVVDAFLALMAAEEQAVRAGSAPRWVIAVNANHNRFEPLVAAHLAAARVPFITRLRHGYVRATPPEAGDVSAPALARWLSRRQGRAVPITEMVRLQSLLARPVAQMSAAEIAAAAHPLLALRAHPALGDGAAEQALAAARPSRRFAEPLAPLLAAAGDGPAERPSRLAQVEDWDDPAFAAEAKHLGEGPFAANWLRRAPVVWARVQVAVTLRTLGMVTPRTTLCVLGGDPDSLELAGRLSLLPLAQVVAPEMSALVPTGPCVLSRLGGDCPARADMVVLTPGSGWQTAPSLVSAALARLAPGGVLAVLGAVPVAGPPRSGCFDPWAVSQGAWPAGGLEPVAPDRCRLTRATADRLDDDGALRADAFVHRHDDGGFSAFGGWFFRAVGAVDSAAFVAPLGLSAP